MSNKPIWQSKTFWANAITTVVAVLGVIAGQGWIQEHPGVVSGIAAAVGLLNIVLRIITVGPVSLTVLLLALMCCTAEAQIQIMPAEKEARLRAFIPRIQDNPAIESKVAQAFLYTDDEIPPAYQFQPLSGGVGTPWTLFFSPRHRHNNIDKYTQANSEFPWADPGGLNYVDQSKVSEFRFLWLPQNPNGGVWPVVVWRDRLQKSNSINMPQPTEGWRWMYPAEAIVGEVLLKKFSDGSWMAYEVRMRLRDIDGWDVEVYRPYKTVDDIGANMTNVAAVPATLIDDYAGRRPTFERGGAMLQLPRLDNAKEVLARPFVPVGGTYLTRTAEMGVEAFTAADDDNIVPANYMGAYLGTTIESCMNCHQHTLRHADSIDVRRDWYGNIRGSDSIFSFHPIAPDAIRPYSNGQTRLREEFVNAGMVAYYDEAKHPVTVYRRLTQFDNLDQPARPSNRRVVGGNFR